MPLQNASAADVVRTIDTLYQGQGKLQQGLPLQVVADERSNSVLDQRRSGAAPARPRAGGAARHAAAGRAATRRCATCTTPTPQSSPRSSRSRWPELAQIGSGRRRGPRRPRTRTAQAEKNALVWADTENNALVITAPPKVMRTILDIVDKLDLRRPEVLVQAIIAEVNVGKTDDLGVNWAAYSQSNKVAARRLRLPGRRHRASWISSPRRRTRARRSATALPTRARRSASARIAAGGESFAAMLRALRSNGDTNVVATPSAVTMDNQAATMKVVQEVPFVTGQYSSQAGITGGTVTPFQTIQQQEVGIVLKVTPTISAEGNAVMLKLSVERLERAQRRQHQPHRRPHHQKRSITTNVLIEDGGIVVLGGLISERAGPQPLRACRSSAAFRCSACSSRRATTPRPATT